MLDGRKCEQPISEDSLCCHPDDHGDVELRGLDDRTKHGSLGSGEGDGERVGEQCAEYLSDHNCHQIGKVDCKGGSWEGLEVVSLSFGCCFGEWEEVCFEKKL